MQYAISSHIIKVIDNLDNKLKNKLIYRKRTFNINIIKLISWKII